MLSYPLVRTLEGMGVTASCNPGSGEFSFLLPIGLGRSASGYLLGELHMEDSPGISNIWFDKSSSIPYIMLGPVTTSLGHSVKECGEETGVNDHIGMAPGESP